MSRNNWDASAMKNLKVFSLHKNYEEKGEMYEKQMVSNLCMISCF